MSALVKVDIQQLPHGDGLALPAYQSAHAAGLDLLAAVPEDAPVTPAAADLYRKVLARQPDQPQALWYAGMAEKQAGNGTAASADWQRLLAQFKPESDEAKTVKQALDSLAAK